ncbi:hypothetical protein BY458DRAFT_503005 [Sporodiniella umbellata]|nr:hypothetical protein BY458DRAFT_503005 [Sporodiniella umbellata]
MKYSLASYSTAILIAVVMGQSTTVEKSNTTETPKTDLTSTTLLSSATTSLIPFSVYTSLSGGRPSITFNGLSPTVPLYPEPSVQGTGWNPEGNATPHSEESWLKQHNRFVFVIFIGLVVFGLLLWYIIRSVKGMRKRLKEENEAQISMMQPSSTAAPRPDNHECATPISPPPAYKFDDHRDNTQSQGYIHPN